MIDKDELRHLVQDSAATAAIEYALRADEGLEFLRCWFHGDFDVIRREWSDAPEDVFIGADPLYRAPGAQTAPSVQTSMR